MYIKRATNEREPSGPCTCFYLLLPVCRSARNTYWERGANTRVPQSMYIESIACLNHWLSLVALLVVIGCHWLSLVVIALVSKSLVESEVPIQL